MLAPDVSPGSKKNAMTRPKVGNPSTLSPRALRMFSAISAF
jgi:hypothetical protein